MPRPKNPDPSYLHHKASGQAIVRLDGRTIYLGKHGSEASLAEYRRQLAEWRARQNGAGPPVLGATGQASVRTVDDLIDAFWVHAEQHYRHPGGEATTELDAFRQSLRPLRRLYGPTKLRDFGPVALETVQAAMVSGSWMTREERSNGKRKGRGLARKVVNQRIGRIRRMFRWGARKQHLPFAVYDALRTVPGLQVGRTDATEYEDVPPAEPELVEATLPELGPVVQAMVRLQQFTGMRPGEVCKLKPRDLDRDGPEVEGVRIWVYRPKAHKGAWRGRKKAVAIGPRAQAVLLPFLDRGADVACFSPAEEMEAMREAAAKRSRFAPRRGVNRVAAPQRQPGKRYTVSAYGKRVRSACLRALAPDWHPPLAVGIEPWHPHQLRHLVGTVVNGQFGLDAARAVLDHKDPKVTLIYAARDLKTASEVAAKIG